MTPEERAERAVDNGDCALQLRLSDGDRETFVENVVREIRAAVADERVECARIVTSAEGLTFDQVAAAIRARGKA